MHTEHTGFAVKGATSNSALLWGELLLTRVFLGLSGHQSSLNSSTESEMDARHAGSTNMKSVRGANGMVNAPHRVASDPRSDGAALG